MKLKLVSLLTAFALILSLVSVTAFADTATIEVGAAKGTYEAGQIVSVDISIKNNPGFVSIQIPVKYDNTVLELVGVEDKEIVSVNGKNAPFTAPAEGISESNPFKKNIAVLTWEGSTALSANCTANGVLATLKFRVLSGVTTGTTTISLADFDSDTFLNYDLDSVAATTKDGTISIKGNCAHANKTEHAAVAATCKDAGNIQYYTCDACGMYFDKSGKQITLADTVIPKTNKHTLKYEGAVVSTTCGQDNVAEHWVCTVCGKLFTDKDGKNETTKAALTTKKAHDLKKVEAVAATCTTNGTKEHYKCTNESCGRLFTDAAGKNETTADKLVIPAAHKLVKTDAKAATCTTPGNKEYWTCDVCKKHFADDKAKTEIKDLKEVTVAALGHKLTKTEKVDSTCTATGHEAYWTCSRCKGIFADEQGATATTLDKLTIAKKAHTSGDYVTNATEHFKTCSVCGTEIEKSREKHTFVKDDATGVETCKCGYAIGGKVDENHQHAAGNDWFRDENNHWHKCTDPKCTAHVDEAKHAFKTVSTTKDGNKTTTVEKCETCGYVKTTTVDNTPVTPVNPSKPGRPSGTKTVQSGKTFDAGVGVYVGLSILSLTGSAVVIGKKRKTR